MLIIFLYEFTMKVVELSFFVVSTTESGYAYLGWQTNIVGNETAKLQDELDSHGMNWPFLIGINLSH